MIFRFYDKIKTMECLQGDTLDVFEIYVDDFGNLENCTMELILEDQNKINIVRKVKSCTAIDGGFTVQLTSADTSDLHGVYNLHFKMKAANGLIYRKLAGELIIVRTVQGG